MSHRKELQYFSNARNFAKGVDEYLGHFTDATLRHRAIGESTPNYLWTAAELEEHWGGVHADDPAFRAGTPERVSATLGTDIRLVVLLRDPVDRAISAFYHHLRARGGGRIDPGLAFEENARRYGILTMGFYAAHLEQWLESFPAERFLVLIQEEMQRAPSSAITAVHRHLGVPVEVPDRLEERVHGGAKFQGADGGWYFDEEQRHLAIGADEIAFLDEVYAPHHERLEDLLGRSLDVWPTVQRIRSKA